MEEQISKYLVLYKDGKINITYATNCIIAIIEKAKHEAELQHDREHRSEIREMAKVTYMRVQENCDHHYGRKEWYGPCSYTETCTKCGHQNDGYERD